MTGCHAWKTPVLLRIGKAWVLTAPDFSPRATEHIDGMKAIMDGLKGEAETMAKALQGKQAEEFAKAAKTAEANAEDWKVAKRPALIDA